MVARVEQQLSLPLVYDVRLSFASPLHIVLFIEVCSARQSQVGTYKSRTTTALYSHHVTHPCTSNVRKEIKFERLWMTDNSFQNKTR